MERHLGYAQVGTRFNPEVGFLPRRAYRQVDGRYFLTYQPKRWPWIRRISPHTNYSAYRISTTGSKARAATGTSSRFSRARRQVRLLFETQQDRPLPFTVYPDVVGRRVMIPAGEYRWTIGVAEFFTDPSAVFSTTLRHKIGNFYDGDYFGWETTINVRAGARLISSLGWNRDKVELKYGNFTNDLLPLKVTYASRTWRACRRSFNTTVRPRRSRRTSVWPFSIGAAPDSSWSTTTAAKHPSSHRRRSWAGRSS